MENNDIFDRIMSASVFNKIRPFYIAHKEVLLYLLFGGLTTLISILAFAFFTYSFHVDELVANIFAWLIAVMFAYFTNSVWVFSSRISTVGGFLKQMLSFCTGRLATLAVEELMLWFFIKTLELNSMAVKIAAQIVVVVLNYIISKLIVFKKKA